MCPSPYQPPSLPPFPLRTSCACSPCPSFHFKVCFGSRSKWGQKALLILFYSLAVVLYQPTPTPQPMLPVVAILEELVGGLFCPGWWLPHWAQCPDGPQEEGVLLYILSHSSSTGWLSTNQELPPAFV